MWLLRRYAIPDAGAWAALKQAPGVIIAGTDGTTYGKLYNWYMVEIYVQLRSNDPSLRKQLAQAAGTFLVKRNGIH
jgi:hypothetical protein